MATILVPGDIAIVHYNTSTDAFSLVFLRDVEAGTTVNFTDNGWLAAGGFRPGEGTVTYTAPAAITAGTVVTLTGLDLDDAGDQIIAYQGDPASPTILHLIDFADGNNTVAGDATDNNTTALPPGFTLGVNAAAVAFDHSLYAGPIQGSPAGLFAALNNSANWLDDDSLPVGLIFNAKPTIDLDSDNSTHTGDDYEASVTSGGPAVPIADADIAISDDDGTDIFAAEFRIIGVDVRDLLTINGALPPGIGAAAYRAPDGILRLEGQASHAAYAAAIRQVEFSTTDTPGDRKKIHVSVFDGQSWSKNGTAFIDVTDNLIVTPPGLDLDANNSSGGGADATATYTAGGPAKSVTDSDVLITDDGTTIASATITILGWARNPGDLLSIAGSLPAGITASSYSAITGVLTLSGPASLAAYQTALHQVGYSNTLASPSTADRGIQVTVDDGVLTSNLATMYMHVVVPPPNIAPVLDLDGNNSTTPGANYLTGFTEGGPPVAIADADVSIFDSDSPSLASATITLTNPQTDDVLTFAGTPPAGIAVSGSGTSVISLTGATSSASYQTALQQIKFSNGNIDPSNVTRVIEVVVNDGISNSNTATAIVQVEAVNNSAPVIDLDPNDSSFSTRTTFRTAFTENGAPIPIADTDTTITDLDSTTLVSATITLANQHPGDLLTVTLPLPGGIVASAYDPGTGALTLTGVATLDEYEAALQQVLYSNTSDNPVTEDRLIEVVVNDGANTSNVAAAVINVVAVNDAPDLHVDTSAVYVENAAAIALSPLATLTDVDDAELNDLVVRITGGAFPGDGDTLTVGGSTSGTINGITFLWNPAELAMVFTGASLVANYQDLLRTVAYHSTNDNPTDFNASLARTLTWSVSGGTAVTTATTTLNIVAVNDAPQATVAAAASYTENGAPVVVSPASTATDVDDIDLVSGEVRIVSGAVAGDLLTVNGLQSGTFSGIEFSYDAVLHSLTFTHPTDVANYEAFLEAVAFSSTSDNPTNSGLNPTRTLSWFLFDGAAISAAQTTVVSITSLADPPVNTVPAAQSVNEDTSLPIAGVSVADVDSSALTTTLTVTSGTLNVTAGPGVTGNGTASVTITGTAAQINAALAGLAYTGNLNFNGPDTLTVTTGDGTTQDIDTVAITVNPLNDAPVNTVPAALSVNEDATVPIAGVSVADVDSSALTTTLTVTSGTLNVTAGAGVTGNGTATVTITGTAAEINTALAGLSYTGNLNFNGPDTLTVTTGDGTAQDIDTVAITVNAVNDAPVNTVPAAQSVNEDTLLPIAGVSVADVDGPALTTTLTVLSGTLSVTAGPGVSGNGTATVTITGTAAEINTGLAGLSYTGNLNFNGPDTLTVTTGDGTAQDIDTVAITVNAVNDPPVNTVPAAQSVNEDTLLPIAGVSVADVDGPALTTTLTVLSGTLSVTAGPGVSGNGTATVTITGTAAEINTALAGLSYTGNLNFNGPDTLTVTTGDGTAQDIDTVAITVNAVNDPPVNTVPAAQSVNEDTLLPIAGVSVADVDGPALTTTLTVLSGTLSVTAGPGVSGNGTATVTITGTAAEINTALAGLAYTGNLDFNGADALTVSTSDGVLTDTDTVAITVNAVNDAPVNTVPAAQSVNEDTLLPIAGVSVADVDGPALTTTLTVLSGTLSVTAGPGVSGNGTATVTITGTAAEINTGLAGLSYTGNLNFNGLDTLTVTTGDGTAQDIDTVAITVNAVNDPPVNTVPAAQSVNEDTLLPIAGVSVADVDGPALTTTLTVLSGTLSVTAGPGVSGNGTATVTITGTAAEINTGLAGLSYTGNLNFNGPDTLTVTTGDGTAQDIDTVAITVNAVNDAPVNTVPAAQSVNEDTLLPIAGVSVADVDGPALTTTLTVLSGTLSVTAGPGVSGNGTATVTITGTAAEINTGLAGLSYTGNLNFNGPDTLTVTTGDGTAQDIDTVAITVNAVNDAPVNTVPAAQSVNEDTLLPIAGVSVADVDGPALTTTLTVLSGTLSVTAGPGVSGNGTATVTITGTAAEINTALAGLSYTGNLNFNGPDTLTVTTGDGTAQDIDTVAITVNAVNDPPVNTVPAAQSVNEDTLLPIAGVSVADVDGPALTTTLTVLSGTLSVTAGPGVTGNGTGSVTITGTAAEINAGLAGLAYTGNLNFNGLDTLTVTTGDGTAQDIDTVAITVNAVNDAPVNTVPAAQSVNEDATLQIAGVSVADVDSSALTTTLSVANGILNATGAGVTGSGTTNVMIVGTSAEINAALAGLAYTGNLDFNGADALTVSTSDGVLTDTDTVAITVNPVNDAPSFTVGANQAVNEDSGPQTVNNFATSISKGPADESGQTVNFIVANNNNALFSAQPTIDAAGNLSYTAAANANGSATVTVEIHDNGGTANGGIDTSASQSFTITVNAVNDAPVATITPTSYTATQNVALSLKNNGLAVSDVDGNSGSETVHLSVTEGVLTVTAGTSGATVNNSGTADVTITGTIAQINALLNTDGASTVTFTDSAVTGDSATLTLAINDSGNTGLGGPLPGSDTATINFTDVLHFVGTNDFDVNGKADILWTHEGSAVLWTNSGAALTEVQVNGHNGAEWNAVGVGHDHASTGELIWSNGSGGNIDVWQFNGTVLSGAAVLPGHMGAEWHVEGLGDFNGDGNTDALWHSSSGNLDVWSMNGLSLNSAVLSNGQIGAEWHVVATGDFFGTGRDAILWESDSGDLQSWSMNGANVVTTANVGQIGAEWHAAGVGHFNNSGGGGGGGGGGGQPPNAGSTDIVWVNTNNDVRLWQMANGVVTQYITPVAHDGTEWNLASVNDFLGNTNSDLLWLRSDGTANIWQINGDQVQSSLLPGPAGDTLQFQASADPSSVESNATTAGPSELGLGVGSHADPIGQHAAELPTVDHLFGGAGAAWHIFG